MNQDIADAAHPIAIQSILVDLFTDDRKKLQALHFYTNKESKSQQVYKNNIESEGKSWS